MSLFTPIDDALDVYGEIDSEELFTTLTENLNYLMDAVPVGEIRPIFVVGSINVPDPRFWQPCDGSLITNTISPLRGFSTPDMRSAVLTINGLIYTAKIAAAITVTYTDHIPPVSAIAAKNTFTDPSSLAKIKYTAQTAGAAGNSISLAYVMDLPDLILGPGAPVATHCTVVGGAITVHIQQEFGFPASTPDEIAAAVNADSAAHALVQALVVDEGTGFPSHIAPMSPAGLVGGANMIGGIGLAGHEVVSVSGFDITVQLESGVSTIQQIQTKVDATPSAAFLVSTDILPTTGTLTQTAPTLKQEMSPGQYLKGGDSQAVAGFTGGQNTKNLNHNHGGATQNFHIDNNSDTDDDRWTARHDHTHVLNSDLDIANFEPAHVLITHYMKIN